MGLDAGFLEETVTKELSSIQSFEDLKRVKVSLLGRKGIFSEYIDQLKTIDKAERGAFGKAINEIKGRCEARLDELEGHYLALATFTLAIAVPQIPVFSMRIRTSLMPN